MNILILNWRDPLNPLAGGAEYITQKHAELWIKNGHQVTWFSTRFPKSKENEILDKINIIRTGNQFTIFFAAFIYILLNSKKYDLIVDEVHGIPFFTPLYTKIPKIVFIHEVAGVIWDKMYGFPINTLGKFLEKLMFRVYRNETFWTDANSTINELVKYGIPRQNCQAIPCPISSVPIKPIVYRSKAPVFISVGRLVKMKGIEDVIEFFKLIKIKLPNAKLWIVGSGTESYLDYLKNKIKFLRLTQSVKFWGHVSEKEKYTLLNQAYLMIHASVKEGWGLVVLEAAAVGTPAVVYNVPGLKDTVRDQATGVIVNNNTPIDLADACLRLYANEKMYIKMQKNAVNWSKSFKWEDASAQSLKLIQKKAG